MKTHLRMLLHSDQNQLLIPKKGEKKIPVKNRPITFLCIDTVQTFIKKSLGVTIMRPETRQSMEMLFVAKWNIPKAARNAGLTDKEMKITFNEYCNLNPTTYVLPSQIETNGTPLEPKPIYPPKN